MIYDSHLQKYIPSAQELAQAVGYLPDPNTYTGMQFVLTVRPLFPVYVEAPPDLPEGLIGNVVQPKVEVLCEIAVLRPVGESVVRYWRIPSVTTHR